MMRRSPKQAILRHGFRKQQEQREGEKALVRRCAAPRPGRAVHVGENIAVVMANINAANNG
jgi:hypothetical protein